MADKKHPKAFEYKYAADWFRETKGVARPDLNGALFTPIPWGSGPAYLIDQGMARPMDHNSFIALYGTEPNQDLVKEYADIALIAPAPIALLDAVLVQAFDGPAPTPVFMIDTDWRTGRKCKRLIPSGEIFEKLYRFSWGKVDTTIPYVVLQGLDEGLQIAGRP